MDTPPDPTPADTVVVSGPPVTVTDEVVAGFSSAVHAPPGELPVTLAAVLTAEVQRELLSHPDLHMDLARTLHTEQASVHHRPIVPGDVLTPTATVTGVRPTRGGRTVTIETELRDHEGRPVQTLSTVLLTGEADS